MPTECVSIKTGAQVRTQSNPIAQMYMMMLTIIDLVVALVVQAETLTRAPEGHSSQCIFAVATNTKNWLFCGESLDDMRAWQLALEQARLLVIRPSYPSHASAMSQNYMNQMSSPLPRHHAPYLPYGHLPPSYIPAFSDGSQTFIPSIASQAHHFSNSIMPNFASPNHNPHYPAMYPYRPQPSHEHLQHLGTSTPGMNLCPRPDGRDVAMGMLAGAAVGSMMWGPYYWW